MKFGTYIKEASSKQAYWISPSGKIVETTSTNHISAVIAAPEKFGYTRNKIQAIYDKHGEALGREANAREEIIVDLVKKGWIRVRKYANQGYSVNVPKMSNRIKDHLTDWADKLINKGINGVKERSVASKVTIVGLLDKALTKMSLNDIAHFKLYEGDEVFDIDNELIIVESVHDL